MEEVKNTLPSSRHTTTLMSALFFGCHNLIDLPVVKMVDRQTLLGTLGAPVICINKEDIIDGEGILDQLWKADD